MIIIQIDLTFCNGQWQKTKGRFTLNEKMDSYLGELWFSRLGLDDRLDFDSDGRIDSKLRKNPRGKNGFKLGLYQ